jgi:sigma-B regulation protein RsbU (phosphoserine phosphatase)
LGSPPVVLESSGFPVGVGRVNYREQVVRLQQGDRLLLYSDGLTEAKNADGEHFGTRRLLGALEQLRHLPLDESLDALLENVEGWRGNTPRHDDIAILAADLVAPETESGEAVAERT